jgi:hypothetical protein
MYFLKYVPHYPFSFQGLAPKDVEALAQKVLFKKKIIFEIFLKSTFLIPKRWF